MSELSEVLKKHAGFAAVISSTKPFRKLDFSETNTTLTNLDLSETSVFSEYVFDQMLSGNAFIGVGGYGENRIIYRQRKHFITEKNDPRCIHLGTDIWTAAGEPVYTPIEGVVHSFAFNNQYGDYGPTVVLRHEMESLEFFTLYGHLSLYSLNGLHEGKEFETGQQLGSIGNYPENGDWPPHLHFQVIKNMAGFYGDFPGVSSIRDQAHYLSICPDPNLILRISENE
jgi:peptidoglycan LD-endopeptidase LytH